MGWMVFLRVALVFAAFYIALPAWARGARRAENSALAVGESFVRLCFFLQLGVLLLGVIRLALPGAVLFLYFAWVAAALIRRRLDLARPETWKQFAVRLLTRPGGMRLNAAPFNRRISAAAVLWMLVPGAFLCARAWFPVHNLRFTDPDAYARALSLAVLSGGENWQMDLSVPLLVPLLILSAATATAVIAFAGAAFTGVFACAAGLLAWAHSRSRSAAFTAAGLAAALPLWRGGAGGGEAGRPEMAAAFGLLALALAPGSRIAGFLSAVLAASISLSFLPALGAGVACALLGTAASRIAWRLPERLRPVMQAAAAAAFIAIICFRFPAGRPDGPFQYEAAARLCHRLAAHLPRNSWLVVSPFHELPYAYGRGWHMELTEFVSAFSVKQVADPAFRFPYPVRDVYFFVEREPLWPVTPAVERTRWARIDVLNSLDPAVRAYSTPLGRTAVEFEAAERLAAYAASHHDLETVFSDGRLSVYHTAGALGGRTH